MYEENASECRFIDAIAEKGVLGVSREFVTVHDQTKVSAEFTYSVTTHRVG